MSKKNNKVVQIEREKFYEQVEETYGLDYTPSHISYLDKIYSNILTMCLGPAGTGKTLFAAKAGLDLLKRGDISRIVLTRPAVEAEKGMGHLPGDLNDKFAPFFEPFEDLLFELEQPQVIRQYLLEEKIIAKPLGYLRGKSFHDAFVILDEGQNVTREQCKLFLTRIGKSTRAVITGDIKQMDIRSNQSGLKDAIERLRDLEDVAIHQFTTEHIKRSDFVRRVIERYEED